MNFEVIDLVVNAFGDKNIQPMAGCKDELCTCCSDASECGSITCKTISNGPCECSICTDCTKCSGWTDRKENPASKAAAYQARLKVELAELRRIFIRRQAR